MKREIVHMWSETSRTSVRDGVALTEKRSWIPGSDWVIR